MIFGQTCMDSKQCASGLFCSSTGGLENTCLKDKGTFCTSTNECANLQVCLGNKCGCDVNTLKIFCFTKRYELFQISFVPIIYL